MGLNQSSDNENIFTYNMYETNHKPDSELNEESPVDEPFEPAIKCDYTGFVKAKNIYNNHLKDCKLHNRLPTGNPPKFSDWMFIEKDNGTRIYPCRKLF